MFDVGCWTLDVRRRHRDQPHSQHAAAAPFLPGKPQERPIALVGGTVHPADATGDRRRHRALRQGQDRRRRPRREAARGDRDDRRQRQARLSRPDRIVQRAGPGRDRGRARHARSARGGADQPQRPGRGGRQSRQRADSRRPGQRHSHGCQRAARRADRRHVGGDPSGRLEQRGHDRACPRWACTSTGPVRTRSCSRTPTTRSSCRPISARRPFESIKEAFADARAYHTAKTAAAKKGAD